MCIHNGYETLELNKINKEGYKSDDDIIITIKHFKSILNVGEERLQISSLHNEMVKNSL